MATLALGMCGLAPVSSAAPRPSQAVVLILSVPGLCAEDLDPELVPAWHEVIRRGAVGWMNVRTASASSERQDLLASGYATLAAGAPATAMALQGAWLPIDMTTLAEENERLPHVVPLGALGQLARSAGLTTVVIGDVDDTQSHPNVLLLAADPKGRVDLYIPSATPDIREPFGLRSQMEAYTEPQVGTLTVWEFGDVYRARAYAPLCLPEAAFLHHRRALLRLNTLLSSRLLPAVDRWRHTRTPYLVFILSPVQAPGGRALDQLAPLAMWTSAGHTGWLTSSSTRMPALVTNFDLVPTVARFLGVDQPVEGFGRPVSVQQEAGLAVEQWKGRHEYWLAQATAQTQLGGAVRLRLAWMVALLTAVWLVTGTRGSLARARWPGPLAMAFFAPLVPQVLSGWWPPLGVAGAMALMLAFCVVMAAVLSSGRVRGDMLTAVLAGAMWLAITVGVLSGGYYLGRAWLGHNVMYGVRYYGIGNELAGAWMACLVLGLMAVPERLRCRVGAGAAALCAVLSAMSWGGANLGASISLMSVAATFAAFLIPPKHRLLASAATLVGAIVLLGLVILLVDYGPAASHLGRALAMHEAIPSIALRKIEVNLRLILTTRWPFLVVAGLAVLYLLRRQLATSWDRHLLYALLLGVGALLVANDSGVVAAGVCLSVVAPALVVITSSLAETPQPQGVGYHTQG